MFLTDELLCFRHPSNLMLDRLSGKILHIDFGDCFEVRFVILSHCFCLGMVFPDMTFSPQVAMTREKFPEKIPFRLTRMLTNAMEVYRHHLCSVLSVWIPLVEAAEDPILNH